MTGKHKSEILTFKAEATLARKLENIPNKSEFIRNAILAALDSACPLCGGSGILSPKQMEHWKEFSSNHELRKCRDCHEYHLICKEEK
jgi:hypothetical protein